MFKNRAFQVKLVKEQKTEDGAVSVNETAANIIQAQAYAAIARKFVDQTIDNASSAIAALLVTKAACDIAVALARRTFR